MFVALLLLHAFALERILFRILHLTLNFRANGFKLPKNSYAVVIIIFISNHISPKHERNGLTGIPISSVIILYNLFIAFC